MFNRHHTIQDTLRISYQYNVQELSGNRRYAKKEFKRGIYAVGLKVDNLSSRPIILSRDNFRVYTDHDLEYIYTPTEYASKVKQRVGLHLLHALWGPWALSWKDNGNGDTEFHFIYIPVGAIVGIGNALRASNANHENRVVQEQNQIWNKTIQPGQSLVGMIAIQASPSDSLRFTYNPSGYKQYVATGTYIPAKEAVSNRYAFYVLMNNGRGVTVNQKIDISGKPHGIAVQEDGSTKIIHPDDTRSLSRVTATGKQLLGLPAGDHWRFKVIPGRISGYLYVAEENPPFVSEIQMENGNIIPFSPEALLEMIGGDPDVMKLVDQKKYVQAIQLYNIKYK